MPVGPLVPAWRLAGQRDPRRGWSKSVWIWRFPALCADVIAFFFSACGGGVGRAVDVLRQPLRLDIKVIAAPLTWIRRFSASRFLSVIFFWVVSLMVVARLVGWIRGSLRSGRRGSSPWICIRQSHGECLVTYAEMLCELRVLRPNPS